MDMEKIEPKLDIFANMVLKDAAHKAGLVLNEAREENVRQMEDQEISFLREAYHSIQESINRIEKENNQLYSAKLFEAKQLLFKKRQEIIDGIFERVQHRLEQYRQEDAYDARLAAFLNNGLREVGTGELEVLVDSGDLARIEKIRKDMDCPFTLVKSEEPLLGGCIVFNRTNGLMADYSFSTRLKQQREGFLEISGMNINL